MKKKKNPSFKTSLNLKERIQEIRKGNVRIAAQTCSMIENEDPETENILRALYPHSGKSMVVGITGPPGAGKSTLVSCLIEEALSKNYSVGAIAVDPSSPITGGALLADRLRFNSTIDPKLFIRSVASRGVYGGLSYATFGILRVLEAMGKKVIFVETVGSGQSEIAVTNLALTTLYVTVPHLGDEIQALKAGILEVSDIFVINKSDLGQSELTESQLRSSLLLNESENEKKPFQHWNPPIVSTSSLKKKNIDHLFDSILKHHKHLIASNELMDRKKRQITNELMVVIEKNLTKTVRAKLSGKKLESLVKHKEDPYFLAQKIMKSTK